MGTALFLAVSAKPRSLGNYDLIGAGISTIDIPRGKADRIEGILTAVAVLEYPLFKEGHNQSLTLVVVDADGREVPGHRIPGTIDASAAAFPVHVVALPFHVQLLVGDYEVQLFVENQRATSCPLRVRLSTAT